MKYSEGYLRTEEPNGVQFIRDLRYEDTQKASAKSLSPRDKDHDKVVSDRLTCCSTMTKSSGPEYRVCGVFHAQQSTIVSGPRDQDHENSGGYLRADEPSVVRSIRDFTSQKQQKHHSKALVRVDNYHENNLQRHLRPAAPRGSHPSPDVTVCHILRAREHACQLVLVSQTMKYSEGYLRPDGASVVRFVQDFDRQIKQKSISERPWSA
jgi:hypothetical protein